MNDRQTQQLPIPRVGEANNIDEVRGQTNVIQSVAHVLAWSQKYMRERNVNHYNYCMCKIIIIGYFHRMNVALLA